MGEFSGWGFGVQPVRGVRRWRVKDGRLTGVFQDCYYWRSGENTAECMPVLPAALVGTDLYYRTQWGIHKLGFERCICGFYAYHNGHPYPHRGMGGVCGIIEGYGHVVIGDHGFRSEKAKILAISPPPMATDRFGKYFYPLYFTLFALYCVVMAWASQNPWMGVTAGVFEGIALAWLLKSSVFFLRVRGLKRNYPEAKFYSSYNKMMDNWPLTPVEKLYPREKEA